MELNYQKSLITASNDSAQEDRDVQKLRDAYNEALTIYNQYSSMDPSSIAVAKIKAEKRLNELTRKAGDEPKRTTDAQNDEEYTKNLENQIRLENAEPKSAAEISNGNAGKRRWKIVVYRRC